MLLRYFSPILFVLVCPLLPAQVATPAPAPSPVWKMPTWPEKITRGHLPYHQLTVEDFPSKASQKKEVGFIIRPFIAPEYEYYLFFNRGWVHAYVRQWHVFSGIDRNESYRDPRFHEMTDYLPYAQAILDLNELYARQLGVVPPDGFPESRAGNEEEATAGLKAKIEALCQQTDAALKRETDDFVKASKNGSYKAKTRRLAAKISERLKAQPEPTPFGAAATATPSQTPSPVASPSTKISK